MGEMVIATTKTMSNHVTLMAETAARGGIKPTALCVSAKRKIRPPNAKVNAEKLTTRAMAIAMTRTTTVVALMMVGTASYQKSYRRTAKTVRAEIQRRNKLAK